MVLKRKDGTPYLLSRPNPLMVDQSLWDEEKINLINFGEYEEKNYLKEIKIINDEVQEEDQKEIPKQIIYCLLAETQEVKEIKDDLYEEVVIKKKIMYTKKMQCQAVIISIDAMTMSFWTEEKLTKDTIVFLPQDKSWWKVSNITEIYECILSDVQPSF